jgi:hypothetical protein
VATANALALLLSLNATSDHHLSKQGAASGSPFCIEQGHVCHKSGPLSGPLLYFRTKISICN